MSKRRPKKSETIEVRLDHEVKTALMRKAQEQGRSTSEVVRSFINSYLADQPREARKMFITVLKPVALASAATLAIIWTGLAPAPVAAAPDLNSVFKALDLDGSGALTAEEFVQHGSGPAIQKMHDSKKNPAHKAMIARHGQHAGTTRSRPTDSQLRAHFTKIDANSDGSVNFAELRAHHEGKKR